MEEGKSVTELVVQLFYKDLQSQLPSRVRCSNPGMYHSVSAGGLRMFLSCSFSENLPVDKTKVKQSFLRLPVAEAFQNLFLDQNIEHG